MWNLVNKLRKRRNSPVEVSRLSKMKKMKVRSITRVRTTIFTRTLVMSLSNTMKNSTTIDLVRRIRKECQSCSKSSLVLGNITTFPKKSGHIRALLGDIC